MSKVLVIGLDGATFDVIHPLVAEARLPTLAHLLRQGAWGPLGSTIPPISPTAWTSMFTGKNPGKHGIFDFQELDAETYETSLVRSDRHREKSIWQVLGEAGKTSMVIDVPFTYPPCPLRGVMITGYGTPRTPGTVFTYPANLRDQIPPALQPEVRVALPLHDFDRSQAFVDEWQQIMTGRRRLLRYLITEHEWDFFFVVFSITDNLAHSFWTFVEPKHPNHRRPEGQAGREAFCRAYDQCDALVGELMTWAGPDTTTLVISDHGFGSVYPRQYLYRRLVEGKFLRYQSPPFLSLFGDQLLKLGMRTYTGLPFLREWAKNLAPQRRATVKRALHRSGLLPDHKAIDYRRSRVLPSNFGLQIWVNGQDRFRHGIITSEAKGKLLDELCQYLQAHTDTATQEPVISAIHRGQDIYHGPASRTGPDAVIDYTNFYRPGTRAIRDNALLEGGHTGTGIFLAYGPVIRPASIQTAHLTDIAPTILYLFGQPIPPDMDGHVIADIFSDAFRVDHPVCLGTVPARLDTAPGVSGSVYLPEEKADLEERLRQLGYL